MAKQERNKKGQFVKGNTISKSAGRKKAPVHFREIKQAFNKNYDEMRKVFEKYIDMSPAELEKRVESIKKKKAGVTVKEQLAIKYITHAISTGWSENLNAIMNVLTGSYGLGVQDTTVHRIEEVGLQVAYDEFAKEFYRNKDKHTPLNVETMVLFLGAQGELPSYLESRLRYFITLIQRYELSDTMPNKVFEDALKMLQRILTETVGKRDPHLFLEVVKRISAEMTPILKAGVAGFHKEPVLVQKAAATSAKKLKTISARQKKKHDEEEGK